MISLQPPSFLIFTALHQHCPLYNTAPRFCMASHSTQLHMPHPLRPLFPPTQTLCTPPLHSTVLHSTALLSFFQHTLHCTDAPTLHCPDGLTNPSPPMHHFSDLPHQSLLTLPPATASALLPCGMQQQPQRLTDRPLLWASVGQYSLQHQHELLHQPFQAHS